MVISMTELFRPCLILWLKIQILTHLAPPRNLHALTFHLSGEKMSRTGQRAPSLELLRFLWQQAKSSGPGHQRRCVHEGCRPPTFRQAASRHGCHRKSQIGSGTIHSPLHPVRKLAPNFVRPPSSSCPSDLRSLSASSASRISIWPFRPKSETSNNFAPNDTPLGDHGELGLAYRGAKKAANELVLRCTEFNENGQVVLTNGEFKKTELIAKYGLLPRDLRKVDSSLLPLVLVRPSAILINLLHLRVLIKHNRVLIFDAYGSTDSFAQSAFIYDLEGKLQSKEGRNANALPYEFRALEAVLISVTTALEAEFESVQGPVVGVLRALEEDIDRDKLRQLLIFSKKLGTFEQKAKLVRDALDELLEEDADLADMYLTEKSQGKLRQDEDDHTEVEMLLESYHKLCDEIVQASGNLVNNIRNTEEIVKAILDANRNSLMLLDLKFSIGTISIGFGTFLAALFGMNLKSFVEEAPWGFYGISAISFLLAATAALGGFRKLRKVQRISMWGEGGAADTNGKRRIRSERGSWRVTDGIFSSEAIPDKGPHPPGRVNHDYSNDLTRGGGGLMGSMLGGGGSIAGGVTTELGTRLGAASDIASVKSSRPAAQKHGQSDKIKVQAKSGIKSQSPRSSITK